MIKLNDNQMYVGHIKQILKDFNLPSCEVIKSTLTEEEKQEIIDNIPKNKLFIKDNGIYLKTEDSEVFKSAYVYNRRYTNITSNLEINNLIYDRYTHRWLGRYLRFLRDYHDLDLMSMYNLFDQESFEGKLNFNIGDKKINFENSLNSSETVFQIPITRNKITLKTFKRTVLHIVVFVPGEKEEDIAKKTYRTLDVSSPYEYDFYAQLTETEEKKYFNQNIKDAYLLIKLPENFNTSLVILEGTDYIDSFSKFYTGSIFDPNIANQVFKVFPQLISLENVHQGYLIADRLLEYLSGNVICKTSEWYEINRLHGMIEKHKDIFKPIWRKDRIYGTWTKSDSTLLKEFIINNIENIFNKYDLLGYLDKDVENLLMKELDNVAFV